jgi:broad specificity phosphatase PhoE
MAAAKNGISIIDASPRTRAHECIVALLALLTRRKLLQQIPRSIE